MTSDTPQAAPAAPPPSTESPGALVRRARERVGLSLDELAAQTKLAHTTLEALERDDFAALLEPVYVRGYYRKCAKVLDLSEELLLSAYSSRVQPRTPQPPARLRLGTGGEGGAARRFGSVLTVALLAVLAGVLIWYLRGGNRPASLPDSLPVPGLSSRLDSKSSTPASTAAETPAATAPSAPPPAAATPAPEVAAVSPAATPSTAPASPAATPSTAPARPAPSPSPAGPASTAPAAAAPVAAAPSAAASASSSASALTLNFASISWARVEDSSGKVLLNRVVQAAERQVLDGKPPYSVFLGNAPGVEVVYRGQPVNFKALIRDTATARFTVPLTTR